MTKLKKLGGNSILLFESSNLLGFTNTVFFDFTNHLVFIVISYTFILCKSGPRMSVYIYNVVSLTLSCQKSKLLIFELPYHAKERKHL